MPIQMKIEGFEDFVDLLGSFYGRAVWPLVEEVLRDIMDRIVEKAEVYPPQPRRDRAKTFNRYVRGVGVYPRSSFNEAGELISLIAGIDRVIFTSEQLSLRWDKQIKAHFGGMQGVIRNTASYSPYVVGEFQTAFHEETGWPTVEGVVEELDDDIQEHFDWLLDTIEQIVLGQVTRI